MKKQDPLGDTSRPDMIRVHSVVADRGCGKVRASSTASWWNARRSQDVPLVTSILAGQYKHEGRSSTSLTIL